MEEREIHFTNKKIDESWKEKTTQDKVVEKESDARANGAFSNLVTSLGMQALLHMGVVKLPDAKQSDPDFGTAREVIDLLISLKEKTKGNLNPDEEQLLSSLIADLQLKFVELHSHS